MQTKKRAKPVKFDGKKKVKKDASLDKSEQAEETAEIVKITETVETPEADPIENEEVTDDLTHLEHDDLNKNLSKASSPESEKETEPEPEEFFSRPPDKYENKKSMLPYFFLVSFIAFLLGLALAGFWGVSGGLYADLWNFPFLGEAGRGNHFMWNSGMELVGLSPWFRFSRPTYQDFFRVPNLTALFLFLVIYPLGIYAGFRLGDRHG